MRSAVRSTLDASALRLGRRCKIWIEIAGPATPQIYEAVPNEIRGMAVWVIGECVDGSGRGYGGFATKDISKLAALITEPDTKISQAYRL